MRNPDDYRNEFWIHINPGDFYQQKGQGFMADYPIELPLSEFQGDEIGQFDEEAITSAIAIKFKDGADVQKMITALKCYILYEHMKRQWNLKEKIATASALTRLWYRVLVFFQPSTKVSYVMAVVIFVLLVPGVPIMVFLLNNDITYHFIANDFFVSVANFINSLLPMAQIVLKRSAIYPDKTSLIMAYGWLSGLATHLIIVKSGITHHDVNLKTVIHNKRAQIGALIPFLMMILMMAVLCVYTPYWDTIPIGRGNRISLTYSLLGPGYYAMTTSLVFFLSLLFFKMFLFCKKLANIHRQLSELANCSN